MTKQHPVIQGLLFCGLGAMLWSCKNDLVVGDLGQETAGSAGRTFAPTGAATASAGDSGEGQLVPVRGSETTGEPFSWLSVQSISHRLASLDGTGNPLNLPWIVNASVHGLDDGNIFIAGYQDDFEGFVDRLADGDLEPIAEPGWLQSIWAASADLQYAAGMSRVFRVSGGTVATVWTAEDVVLMDVWGLSPDDVVVVGFGGTVVRHDGETWATENTSVTTDLHAVWGSDPDHLFAVGKGGTILHGSKNAWTPMDSGTTLQLNSVWGTGPEDVYAVGGSELDSGHIILHYDGIEWTPIHEGDQRLSSLLGVSGADGIVYVVGASRNADSSVSSEMYRFDGVEWLELPFTHPEFLWDVWCMSDKLCNVVGPNDTVLEVALSEASG